MVSWEGPSDFSHFSNTRATKTMRLTDWWSLTMWKERNHWEGVNDGLPVGIVVSVPAFHEENSVSIPATYI